MPDNILNSHNLTAIATSRVDGSQIITLLAGQQHVLAVDDQDGWDHAITVLDGLVSYAGTVYQPEDEFTVIDPPQTPLPSLKEFIAQPGDFTVLLIESLISPGGIVVTVPKEN